MIIVKCNLHMLAFKLVSAQLFCCTEQKSLSETSKPETPTNGTACLALSVPDEQLPQHSDEVKHSDNSSCMSSPLSPSGAFSLTYCITSRYNVHCIDHYYHPPSKSECILYTSMSISQW